MGCRVREGEGKAARQRFDSANHAWGRTADGLQKLFGPKMNWAPQQNFKFNSRF
jgi:hypothetical protein